MFRCHQCRKPVPHKPRGEKVFCGKRCFGLSRRNGKTKAQRVEEKRLYDIAYRAKNIDRIKAFKRDYFQRTYDPVEAAKYRKKRMPKHVEYCRQPRYKAWKREYDQKRRDSLYGPFADAARLAITLNREIKTRASNYEIRLQNQTLNKSQARRREAPGGDRHPRTQG